RQPAQLLLLAQPDRVLRGLAALRLRHARRRGTLVQDALGVALVAFEEQLHLLPPAEAANRSDVSCHGSDSPGFGRTAAVVRQGRHVLDAEDVEAGGLQRADRGLAARAGAVDEHGDLLDAELDGAAADLRRGHLRGEGRALAGALEAGGA